MARKPSPWWWDEEQGWYVNYRGKRRFLGRHPAGARKPQKSDKTGKWNMPKVIEDAFLALIASGEPQPQQAPPEPVAEDSVVAVLDDFITWCKENRAAFTAERYEQFIQDFVKATGEKGIKFGALPVSKLTSKHVTAWLNQRPSWNSTTKRNAITAVQRGLNWAVKNRGLDRNPIRGMDKPEAQRRREIVTPEEFEATLAHELDCG